MPEEPRRYLLAVGIPEYNNWPPLSDVPKELECVVNLLTDSPFRFERILRRPSEAPHTENLVTALTNWANASERRPTDQLIIYWTGHGEVQREELHLILNHSGREPLTDTILAQTLVEKALPDQGVTGGILLMLDVCYSGHGAIDVARRLGAINRAFHRDHLPEIVVLSASRPRERARQNTFSKAFAKALYRCQQDAQEHEPQLYLDKLLDYLVEDMRNAPQKPVMFNQRSKATRFVDGCRKARKNGDEDSTAKLLSTSPVSLTVPVFG